MSDKTTIQCPACHEDGRDKTGNHLKIFPGGKFSCAIFPGDKAHNRRIIDLRPELGKDDAPGSFIGRSDFRSGEMRPPRQEVGTYLYRDATGVGIYEVVRYEPKDFRQRQVLPDGSREWNLEGIVRVPYRLPEILAAPVVWIVEGEKDADNLVALGIVATCNAGGAGKWESAWTNYFAGKEIILCGDNDEPGRKHMDTVAEVLKSSAKSIKRLVVPDPHKDISDLLEGLSNTEAIGEIEKLQILKSPLSTTLDARRFDLLAPPPPARPVYRIGQAIVATPGNLCVIAAQAKAGKSALVGAFIAAATGRQGDTLGIGSSNSTGGALIHFDTEQSPCDHHSIVATALRRVGADTQPPWLRSYRIADVSMRDRFGLLEHELERARNEQGGIHSVLLDGIADLINDPNDPAEAFAAVDRLHGLAVTFDTNIVCVLHFNPGSEFNKTRGHLGSQLERKAETNLALEKTDGVTVVYTKLARHAHIEKDQGARFQWDAEAGMHLSCGSAQDEKAAAKEADTKVFVARLFETNSSMTYGELRTVVMQLRGVTKRNAEKYIAVAQPNYIKQTPSGLYQRKL